ncbi:TetR family transcriptional regulator [Yersinia enterocolitica]|uniref:TetR family transcriptional regulator n=1 Tax=Yersinia TaxID=629 RepID=UPI0005DFE400|nr:MULTISPECIES: TetR family transcriptional regulator [Yersinia]EKN3360209.1 TetR family transcriptional regulator [Yersinia ruckeri]EKN3687227.1 TetR family transcriptional regulator [Yersinia enterocolitica]EKN3887663.1 TetR family transcriptional regulator [Yersinia enterocolitica]EKN4023275.1 TetR family transcriptional regulator [Yersinia enterocolitica]EKN4071884.1 TetR family transcriptional regulator [Yersinia enterocolitica]
MTIKFTGRQPLVRSRSKTLDALNKAIDDLVEGNEKISIASVARAAGVTPSLIHNTYPAVAERIRIIMGKPVRTQRDSKHQTLMVEKEKNRALRVENDQLLEELARIASVNQRLLFEMAELKAAYSGEVVSISSKPRR